jgi:hypothetical protein
MTCPPPPATPEWQHLFERGQFCRSWQDSYRRKITAMLTLTFVALAVAVAALLHDLHRAGRLPFRLVQFRAVAPLVGGAATARVGHPSAGREKS